MKWASEVEKGATVWRQIGPVRVLMRHVSRHQWTGYNAYGPDSELPVASFHTCAVPGAFSPSGHVGGVYARVQGRDADVQTVTDWLAAVEALVAVSA